MKMRPQNRSGILAAGNLLVDHVLLIDHYPKAGTLVTMNHVRRSVGGAPLNVLITLAKMGVPFALAAAGICGEDENGRYLEAELEAHCIDRALVKTSGKPTSYTYVMTEKETGARTFFHDLGANPLLDGAFFAEVNTNHRIFHLGYLLLLAGLDQKEDRFGTQSARLFHDMQTKGYETSLDLVSVNEPHRFLEEVLPCLPYLDYLIINELEAEMLSGLAIRDDKGAFDQTAARIAATALAQKGVQKCVVIHAPEGGVAYFRADKMSDWQEAFCPSFFIAPEEIKGTVGAGDAFCAGMLFALHEKKPIAEALKIANACAWFNLHAADSVSGSQDLKEIEAFMARS